MEAIILAAGYATRLYPLTIDTPKPLLKVAGRPIIEHILEKLRKISLNKIFIVTNNKFEPHFSKWLENYETEMPIEIVNDGTSSNDDRLGALGDIHFTVENKEIDDSVITIAGDNLFELELDEPLRFFRKKNSDTIVLYDVQDGNLAKQYGIVELDGDKLSNFKEKPQDPKSTLASTGIYIFTRKTIELIKKYLEQGNNPDKTGSFIEWLHKRKDVFGFVTQKKWYDIGSLDQLKIADKHYGK